MREFRQAGSDLTNGDTPQDGYAVRDLCLLGGGFVSEYIPLDLPRHRRVHAGHAARGRAQSSECLSLRKYDVSLGLNCTIVFLEVGSLCRIFLQSILSVVGCN